MDLAKPLIHAHGVCYDCQVRHEYAAEPAHWLSCLQQWRQKHLGHRVEFHSPKRRVPRFIPKWMERLWERANRAPWWMDFKENADVKLAFDASAAMTITLASLATSSTLVAGRQSTVIDNTGLKLFLDYLCGGKVTTGTSPTTAKSIWLYVFGSLDDTPTYPDVLGASDAGATFTSVDIRNASIELLRSTSTDNTSNRAYPLGPRSIALAFGGLIPKKWGAWVTHDTAVNLNSTGGNHVISHTGAYLTAI